MSKEPAVSYFSPFHIPTSCLSSVLILSSHPKVHHHMLSIHGGFQKKIYMHFLVLIYPTSFSQSILTVTCINDNRQFYIG
jgi:hypothetical protein